MSEDAMGYQIVMIKVHTEAVLSVKIAFKENFHCITVGFLHASLLELKSFYR